MFAYCNNNPVNLVDGSGAIPFYDHPYTKALEDFIKWYQETDEDETDDTGRPTLNAKAKRIIHAFLYNLEFSSGVGLGYFGETTVLEAVGLGLGVYGNFLAIRVQDGQVEFGQEYNSGISASLMFHNYGFTEYAFNKDFKPGPIEVSKGFYGDDTYTIFSAAGYLGIGGSIRIGFDIIQFGYDVAEIIR